MTLIIRLLTALVFFASALNAHARLLGGPLLDEDFGQLTAGSYFKSAELPDMEPNVLWFGFILDTTANVALDTFDSELEDTVMSLYNSIGDVLGQNDDCESPEGSLSCLYFSGLAAATYQVGVVEYTSDNVSPYDDITFENLWQLNVETESGDDSVTLNIRVSDPGNGTVPVPSTLALFAFALVALRHKGAARV